MVREIQGTMYNVFNVMIMMLNIMLMSSRYIDINENIIMSRRSIISVKYSRLEIKKNVHLLEQLLYKNERANSKRLITQSLFGLG